MNNFCVQYARRLSTGWLFRGVDVPRACVKYNVVVLTVRSFRLRCGGGAKLSTRRRTRGVYIRSQELISVYDYFDVAAVVGARCFVVVVAVVVDFEHGRRRARVPAGDCYSMYLL